jgi:hypothetical protein
MGNLKFRQLGPDGANGGEFLFKFREFLKDTIPIPKALKEDASPLNEFITVGSSPNCECVVGVGRGVRIIGIRIDNIYIIATIRRNLVNLVSHENILVSDIFIGQLK